MITNNAAWDEGALKLFAISDLHVGFRANADALSAIRARPDDWIIVAGDVAERESDVRRALSVFCARYRKVIWVPGNHELWTISPEMARGEQKYRQLVECCRELGVVTPEDPYPLWDGEGGPHLIAPLFLLYDYSFADDGLAPPEAVRWASEAGILCADEELLHPEPFATREAWCEQRCRSTEARLEAAVAAHGLPLVLVNHFPLRREHAHLPAIPRFKIWCGTRRTEAWASRFGAAVVVTGHLHIRSTRVHEGTRFEEVSLGYPPRQWDPNLGIDRYIRQVLPTPQADR
jgi:3',5'-cyclic AMP phosphodiesterase CpdA